MTLFIFTAISLELLCNKLSIINRVLFLFCSHWVMINTLHFESVPFPLPLLSVLLSFHLKVLLDWLHATCNGKSVSLDVLLMSCSGS